MEKWRIYLILAGAILIIYNVDMAMSMRELSIANIIGILSSIAFMSMLYFYRKK